MAVASLVFGILGVLTCGVTALVGLILGLVSMGRIKKSGGRLGGSGIALAGTIVSAVFLLMLPVLAAMLLPALAKAKQKAQTIQCLNNSRQLALAVRIYASENKNQLPPAATWCDAIQRQVGSDRIFKCSAADVTERCSYAFNSKLNGADVDKLDPNTVVIFESSGGWNLSGGRELLPQPSRHGGKFIIAFADGHAEVVPESRINALHWDP
jgi:prepilin-type processing-associated H-X9-DG protein